MKRVVVIIAALIVCTSFSFALDDESTSFDAYSFDPLTMSALDYGVSLASATSWDTSDQKMLADIRNAFYASGSGASSSSLLGNIASIESNFDELIDILDWSPSGTSSSLGSFIKDIRNALITSNTHTAGSLVYNVSEMTDLLDTLNRVTVPYGNNKLDLIYQDTSSLDDTVGLVNHNFLSLLDSFHYSFADVAVSMGQFDESGQFQHSYWYGPTRPVDFLAYMSASLTLDGVVGTINQRSLYSRIKQMQEVLASDDDLALAESQKQNREEIEDSFLNGSSGSTSLGASDFGDLSDIGGTVKDSISLNGQASVSSFTSGLAGADESGQGWFSAATRDSLDSVSSSVSTFSMDDPYNMSGWYERYAWVEGD